jgi:hypothetical protein
MRWKIMNGSSRTCGPHRQRNANIHHGPAIPLLLPALTPGQPGPASNALKRSSDEAALS